MNKIITQIATSHQKQMRSVHPHAIIGTIEDAIEEALKNEELVKLFSSNLPVIKSVCDHEVWINIDDIHEQCGECGEVRKR